MVLTKKFLYISSYRFEWGEGWINVGINGPIQSCIGQWQGQNAGSKDRLIHPPTCYTDMGHCFIDKLSLLLMAWKNGLMIPIFYAVIEVQSTIA